MTLARAEEPKKSEEVKKKTVHEFTVRDIDGKDVSLSKYAGDVLLIVNVASECGYTDVHYRELEPMYRKYKDQGFRVLAFPSDDFGQQEPGTAEQIKSFCKSKYDVSFDLFEKVAVKGEKKCPLYKYLTEHPDPAVAGEVKWNFQKYLVGRDGKVLSKFETKTPPSDPKVVAAVEEALKQGSQKEEVRSKK